ncbi:MAG: hypothetical protein LBH07_00910 [Treponema sp.]|jgi:hypothetical protein|nr:hypothetical protein [Treponema sp.]
MQIHDASIIRLIERIGDHYKSNISNRFVRPALLQLHFDNQSWELMEDLTERDSSQAIHLDELYHQIIAAAKFVSVVRRELPMLWGRVARPDPASSDRVLREMAINNFGSNLQVFADLLNELFIKLVETDKARTKKTSRPIYTQIPELSDVARLLTE